VIEHERRHIRLQVEMISHTPATEKFKVTARNTSFTLQSNRPMLIAKGLKYKPINWKIIEGSINRPYIEKLIITAIEAKLQEL
jgi:TolB-like protein